jgi:hypothetical protein
LQDVGLHLDLVREIGILEMCRKVESRELALASKREYSVCCMLGCMRDWNSRDVKKY